MEPYMNFPKLQEQVSAGQKIVVRIKERLYEGKSRDCDYYASTGMMARIASVNTKNDLWKVELDYSQFDEHNIPLEPRVYNDGDGNFVMTAREANAYLPSEIIYFDADENLDDYFDFVDQEYFALFDLYQKEKSDESYVRWLENKVIGNFGLGLPV